MTNQIWQCEGCGRTFPEYVNGCPFADNDPTHPKQMSVVIAVESRAD